VSLKKCRKVHFKNVKKLTKSSILFKKFINYLLLTWTNKYQVTFSSTFSKNRYYDYLYLYSYFIFIFISTHSLYTLLLCKTLQCHLNSSNDYEFMHTSRKAWCVCLGRGSSIQRGVPMLWKILAFFNLPDPGEKITTPLRIGWMRDEGADTNHLSCLVRFILHEKF